MATSDNSMNADHPEQSQEPLPSGELEGAVFNIDVCARLLYREVGALPGLARDKRIDYCIMRLAEHARQLWTAVYDGNVEADEAAAPAPTGPVTLDAGQAAQIRAALLEAAATHGGGGLDGTEDEPALDPRIKAYEDQMRAAIRLFDQAAGRAVTS